jgi:AraC family transcriptional regulator
MIDVSTSVRVGPSFLDPNWVANPPREALVSEISAPFVTFRSGSFDLEKPVTDLLYSETISIINMAVEARLNSTRVRIERDERNLGDIFFLPHGVPMEISCERGDRKNVVWALIDLPGFCAAHDIPELDCWPVFSDIQEPRIRDCMMRINHELIAPGFAASRLVEATLTCALIELIRYSNRIQSPQNRCHLTQWQHRVIMDRLRADLKPPQIIELAGLCNISPRHLTRVFKATTGFTLTQYISKIQIERAKYKLLDPTLAIKEVAFELGMDIASFYAKFRRATGLTPVEYRREKDIGRTVIFQSSQ